MSYEMDWRRDHGMEHPELAGDSAMWWFGLIGIMLLEVIVPVILMIHG